MTMIEQKRMGASHDVDEGREERGGTADAVALPRPGCVFTAALRHRVEGGDAVGAAAPPHLATFGSEASEQLWTEWAERVRAAVAVQRPR